MVTTSVSVKDMLATAIQLSPETYWHYTVLPGATDILSPEIRDIVISNWEQEFKKKEPIPAAVTQAVITPFKAAQEAQKRIFKAMEEAGKAVQEWWQTQGLPALQQLARFIMLVLILLVIIKILDILS